MTDYDDRYEDKYFDFASICAVAFVALFGAVIAIAVWLV